MTTKNTFFRTNKKNAYPSALEFALENLHF